MFLRLSLPITFDSEIYVDLNYQQSTLIIKKGIENKTQDFLLKNGELY